MLGLCYLTYSGARPACLLCLRLPRTVWTCVSRVHLGTGTALAQPQRDRPLREEACLFLGLCGEGEDHRLK